MKTGIPFFMLLFAFTAVFAQQPSVSPQVIASAGNSGSAGSYIIDWTLGETVIETIEGTNNILTQGMHQTKLVVTGTEELIFPGLEVKVYPNPTSDILMIEIIQSGNDIFSYELTDIAGRKIALRQMQSDIEELDMSNYVSGIYMIRVINLARGNVKVCKIIKN